MVTWRRRSIHSVCGWSLHKKRVCVYILERPNDPNVQNHQVAVVVPRDGPYARCDPANGSWDGGSASGWSQYP